MGHLDDNTDPGTNSAYSDQRARTRNPASLEMGFATCLAMSLSCSEPAAGLTGEKLLGMLIY